MAITDNGTAHAVNVLARWLFGHKPDGMPDPTAEQVNSAFADLADAAHTKLGAGIDGAQVRELMAEGGSEGPGLLLVVARALYCVYAAGEMPGDAPFALQRISRSAEEAELLIARLPDHLKEDLTASWQRDQARHDEPAGGGGAGG
jgi:hypothetical protein